MSTQSGHPKKWLIAYNSISTSLWSVVLFNAIFLGLALGQPMTYEKTNRITTGVQSLAVIEIINAALGIVRSSVFVTSLQIYSRILVVWGIFQFLPNSPANGHWSYITVSIAWGLSEIIRYSYHASSLRSAAPYWLVYTRYTAFIVLYPIGVGSEMMLMYLSLDEAKTCSNILYYFYIVNLVFWPLGLAFLYTHMLKSRKKVLNKYNSPDNAKKTQ